VKYYSFICSGYEKTLCREHRESQHSKKRISTTSIAKNALYFQELSLSHSFFPDPALK
jgi:hypothetical protein